MGDYSRNIRIGGRVADLSRPWVLGIINVTPDSFFAGSRTFSTPEVEDRARRMADEGADCFDVGGYSSRPGADEVSADEEWSRLARGLEALRRAVPDAVVSVDTFRADVARRCVEQFGVQIVNDISGGDLDPEMWDTVADLGVAYVLMHMRGNPQSMQSMTDYADVTADVLSDLAFKTDALRQKGVADIIIDPGFGFAKTVDQNFRLLAEMDALKALGCPILAGLSHKTMIWRTLGITPDESLDGTIALDTVALMKGADILRVHEVRPAAQTVRLIGKLREISR